MLLPLLLEEIPDLLECELPKQLKIRLNNLKYSITWTGIIFNEFQLILPYEREVLLTDDDERLFEDARDVLVAASEVELDVLFFSCNRQF